MHTTISATSITPTALAMAMTLILLASPAGAGQITVPANDTTAAIPALAAPDPATQQHIRHALGKLPLHFEANTGQSDAQVKFLARTAGYTLFLTPTEAVLTVAARPIAKTGNSQIPSFRRTPGSRTSMDFLDSGVRRNDKLNGDGENNNEASVLRLHWLNANPEPKVRGADLQPGKSAYFIGNDATKWRSDVAHYGKVHYEAVYPGIDLVYYGNQSKIEYDFVVQPGADPEQIRLSIDGAKDIHLDDQGNLVLSTTHGDLLQQAPIIYQEIDGERVVVEGQYVLHANNEVGFLVAAYDVERTLVIDPILQSTYLGGSSGDFGQALAIHPTTGDVYVAGYTLSNDFPGIAGGADTTFGGTQDAFIARLNSTLTSLTQATFLGGSGIDVANAIAIHPVSGNVYVAGDTQSSDLPGLDSPADGTFGGTQEAFVAYFSSDLSGLVDSTFLGGSNVDTASALAIHPVSGDVYVAGYTDSNDFPGIAGGADSIFGGTQEAFVVRLNSFVSFLAQATFLGGSSAEAATALVIHPVSGDVYVAGYTQSNDFPGIAGGADTTFGGTQEAFVARLNSALTGLTQATFLGGSGNLDLAFALAIHPVSGDVYTAGNTQSSDFPGIAGGADTTFGGTREAFVGRLNSALTSLTQATFLGGSGNFDFANALAIHPVVGDVYVAGYTFSSDFPGIAGGADTTFVGGAEAFVARLTADLAAVAAASADLSLTLTDAPDPVIVGGTLTYTATLTNNGPDAASGVALTDTLPAVTFVSVTASQGSCAQSLGVVSCSLGALANAASATITIVVTPTAAGALSNTASVTATESDPNAANNSATATSTVSAATDADLALAVSASPSPVGLNATLTYSHTITNNGPATASAAMFTHTLPASGISFTNANASQGSCSGAATVSCTLGALASGASATVTITVTTTATGTLTSSASVASTEPDPNAANNSATATVSVVQTICSNSLQAFASNLFGAQAAGCSVSIGPSATGGGGAFDPFLLAGMALLYLGRVRRRNRVLLDNVGRGVK